MVTWGVNEIIEEVKHQLDQAFQTGDFKENTKGVFQNALDLAGITQNDYDSRKIFSLLHKII